MTFHFCERFFRESDLCATLYTVLQKKSSVHWAILFDSRGWRSIKRSLMHRFFVSHQEGIFWPFEVSAFSYFVVIFNLWWFQWKFLKLTQFVDPIKESTWDFFQNFSSISIPKNEAQKVKKRDSRIFQFEKRDLGRPEGSVCGLKFFGVSRVVFDAIGEVPNSFIA